MSSGICSCENPTFGNMGKPNCVITQKALAFPMFIPRFQKDGTRNVIYLDDSTGAWTAAGVTNVGDYVKYLISQSDPQKRLYPMARVENSVFDRTDTVYETAPSTRKFKIDGVGGVRTWAMELWGDSATHNMLRELKKFGCSDIDAYYVDVAGAIWGILDDVTDVVMRGYEVSSETFDAFKIYATETTVGKIAVSFDLDNDECEENSYAITAEELGYKATTLAGLITAYTVSDNPDLLTLSVDVHTFYGSASVRQPVVGLLDVAFVVKDSGGVIIVHTTTVLVENPDGTYLLTFEVGTPLIAAGDYTVDVVAAGYEVASSVFTA